MSSTTQFHVYEGVPAFFVGHCHEASQGGKHSFRDVGYHFARATGGMPPCSASDSDWAAQVEELTDLANLEDRLGVWRWYTRTYPECMKLVPSKRKEAFIDGVLRANEEDLILV